MSNLQIFIDFDGTVTQNDVIDTILERCADPKWRQIESLWSGGEIGSRECLSRQFDLVRADKNLISKILGEIQVDPGFELFLDLLNEYKIPASIVSDGLDLVIQHVIKKRLPVFSNKLHFMSHNRVRVSFSKRKRCEHGCANCKVAVMKKHRKAGRTVIFIGDGLSDRFAAHAADFVFAKKKLLKYCKEHKINHIEYNDFHEINKRLRDVIAGSRSFFEKAGDSRLSKRPIRRMNALV